ncbi:ATPase [Sphingomonas panacisoli]|uniref:ATPase n=1 Tax=Sphingomonas panacisoli TaxID=1813879 RepID=A0A5B8LFM7_9SPHN|nr:SRPBCC family protein [Sphingomonas panacisoli]QDZ07058.1 ATPase [Sphingomonas panacisoli]
MLRFTAFAPLALIASPATADVVDSSAAGFTVSKTVSIAATPDAVWETLRAPQRWWAKEHTWSGDSTNLYIDSQATGCFCEKLPGRGSVAHARLIFVDKGKLLRMEGAFGPLQAYAMTGVMTFELSPDGDKATTLKMTYTVSGYMSGGFEKMAAPVDGVLGEQVAALKAAAEAPPPAK